MGRQALVDTKEQIKALRRQRQDIFKTADETAEKRDFLIASLERRLARRTAAEMLFTIRWAVA